MRASKKFWLWTVALSAVGFAVLTSQAAEPGENAWLAVRHEEMEATSQFITSTWRTGEGLPVNEIEELKETPDGYLWMGTPLGLVRFDGVRFESFFNTPTGTRYGTRVGPLEIDARGQLWFAPDQVGVMRRDAAGFTEVMTNGTMLHERIFNLCSDGTNGLMWVDVKGWLGRTSLEKGNPVEILSQTEAFPGAHWLRDYEGHLWLAHAQGLKKYQKGKLRDVAMPGNASFVATPRRDGGMWVARDAKLRIVTDKGPSRELAVFPWAGQTRVTCLWEDSRKRLWIGTLGQGLFCYSNGEFKQVLGTASTILCLLEDSQDNLWAGTRGGGLVRIRQRQFFMHDVNSGLKHAYVRSVSQDQAGRIWLLTADGGLGWFKDGVWNGLNGTENWRGYDSHCVLPRKDGTIWISTIRHGLWCWDNGQLKRKPLGPGAPSAPIITMLEDRRGRLWMMTGDSGVYCLENDKLTSYTTAEGLPSQYIRTIVEDEKGDLWAGDWAGGITRFNGHKWETVRNPSGHSDSVRCMVVADGALWIGTTSGGLLRFKNNQTTRISMEQGLPDVCVQQLLLDGQGSLWGGTTHRLFSVTLAQLNEVADGRRQKIEANTYGRSDGLPDVAFANWSNPRCWRATNGELWLATANGVIYFQPANLREGKAPQILLEQTLLDGKPVNDSVLQHLRPGANRVEFRFTAPCLTAPERVHFRYKLSGVDTDWIGAGTTRSAVYANLPPGEHAFRVLASNAKGGWDTPPAVITVAVHPFFWKTSWFIALVAGAVAGGGVWLVRRATVQRLNQRVEVLRQRGELDRERARIAQDIHDELGANLTSIGLLADMGKRHKSDPGAVVQDLGQISQTARESVTAMDAIVWALNPRNDSLDHFANYVAQFTREFFRPTQLRTRLDLPADLPEQPMSTETRHQLFLIVKEAFNNIVRHAEASEVNLELSCANGCLRLVIADDGKGLPDKTEEEGHDGLANLRERIERLGGQLSINSQPGRGTKLEFVLPMIKSPTK